MSTNNPDCFKIVDQLDLVGETFFRQGNTYHKNIGTEQLVTPAFTVGSAHTLQSTRSQTITGNPRFGYVLHTHPEDTCIPFADNTFAIQTSGPLGGTSYYTAHSNKRKWTNARDGCISLGGHLASFHTENEKLKKGRI